MNIEELLNKYFDGDTTCEEERELRRFFTQETVPEHLKEYSPLFAFLDKENKQAKEACTDHSSLTVSSRKQFSPSTDILHERNSCRITASIGHCRHSSPLQRNAG